MGCEMEYADEDATEDTGFHITGYPVQPILPCRATKSLPLVARQSFVICL